MTREILLLLALTITPTACRRRDEPAQSGAAGSSGASTKTTAPTRGSGPRTLCPFAIEPGVALGPIALGETLPQLEEAGLVVTRFKAARAQLVIPGADGPGVVMHVALKDGEVAEVWVEDLALAPDCVELGGRSVARGASRAEIARRLGGCAGSGGSESSEVVCAEGGVYVGGRDGTAQVGVRRRGGSSTGRSGASAP